MTKEYHVTMLYAMHTTITIQEQQSMVIFYLYVILDVIETIQFFS
jgi:hypothetical protein